MKVLMWFMAGYVAPCLRPLKIRGAPQNPCADHGFASQRPRLILGQRRENLPDPSVGRRNFQAGPGGGVRIGGRRGITDRACVSCIRLMVWRGRRPKIAALR